MKPSRLLIVAAVVCLTLGCLAFATGCQSKWTSTANTGLVAATVNGVEVSEDKVTKTIEDFRESGGYDTADAWKTYLETYGYTSESLRNDVLDGLIDTEVMRQGAASKGITVSESEIDTYVSKIRNNYSSDEAWQKALEDLGMDEQEYRDSVRDGLLEERLMAIVAPSTTAPTSEVLEYCNSYASYYDGMKRSSHILFSADDTELAQQVLDQLNAGSISFDAAARQYSQDTGSAVDGGDVGWDSLNSFVDEYTEALDELEKGQISGLVTSSYGIHIIKCTDVFEAPDTVTYTGQIPSELLTRIKSYADSSYQSTTFNKWIESYREKCEIVINDMPDNMSYYVYIADETEEETEDEATTEEETEEASEESSDAATE